jgi:integrase
MKPRALGNGLFKVDAYLPDGARLRRRIQAANQREANKMALELIARESAEATKGAAARGLGPTLDDTYRRAWTERTRWIQSKNRATIDGTYKAISAHFGPGMRMHKLDKDSILNYRKVLIESGASASTVNQRLSMLSVLFETAGMEFPRKLRMAPAPGRTRILTPDEEAQAVAWFESRRDNPLDAEMLDLIPVLIDTGLRLSEALGIGRYGPRGKLLTHYEASTGRLKISAEAAKGAKARTVPCTKRVQAVLSRRQRFELTKDSAGDRWELYRKANGLWVDREFVLHAMRHTCATRLAMARMDSFAIQKWMGHASITTTMIYVNLANSVLDPLADALDAYDPGRMSSARNVPERTPQKANSPAMRVPERRARPNAQPGQRYDSGLLIRRSLVRAQVGEPNSTARFCGPLPFQRSISRAPASTSSLPRLSHVLRLQPRSAPLAPCQEAPQVAPPESHQAHDA